ncbi:MAG: hypothetical protein WB523_16645 [Candidatus Sulfotelmatobacter sp.]
MSRKKWANYVVKQREWRKREAEKKHKARLSEIHKLGGHTMRNGQPYIVKGCPLCNPNTVTQNRISVTVMERA